MSITDRVGPALAEIVKDETRISVSHCYQCGKCSAGCPAGREMDIPPSIVMRLLQIGKPDSDAMVLGSYGIWLCLTCYTCFSRCPMEIDLTRVMDVLRSESLKRKMVHRDAMDILGFHKSFMSTVRRFGRMWEAGLVAEYKLRTRHVWQDVALVPGMLKRGKLALFPSIQRKFVNRIFRSVNKPSDDHK
jgi:heterodisulfide reductase subunit C